LTRVLLLLAGALTATALLAATLLTTALTGLLVLLAALARTIVRIVRHGRCTPVVQIPVQDNARVATSFRTCLRRFNPDAPRERRSIPFQFNVPCHGAQDSVE
jgi:hypothetical protein